MDAVRMAFILHGSSPLGVRETARFVATATSLDPILLGTDLRGTADLFERYTRRIPPESVAFVLLTHEQAALPGAGTEIRAQQDLIYALGYMIGAMSAPYVFVGVQEGLIGPTLPDDLTQVSLSSPGWLRSVSEFLVDRGVSVDQSGVQ